MAHSIELLLDSGADAEVRSTWRTLAEAGLPSPHRIAATTNRPHVTLVAAAHIDRGVDAALADLTPMLPLEAMIGAALVFAGPRHTLARLIVPSAALLDLHAAVDRLCRPWTTGEPFPHCRPGEWTAHVTLGRRLDAADVGAALTVIAEQSADTACRFVGLRRWDGDRRVEHLLVGEPGDLH